MDNFNYQSMITKEIDNLNEWVYRRVKERVAEMNYVYHPSRIVDLRGVECTLFYFINDHGMLEPIIAFGEVHTSHYGDDPMKNNITITVSRQEMPMSVFKPKI